MRTILGSFNLNLRTKLLLILIFLSLITILALSVLYVQGKEDMVLKLGKHTEGISEAIRVSVEKLTLEGNDSEVRLRQYIKELQKKGIKEVSIISNADEVIASSDPGKLGTKVNPLSDSMITEAILDRNFGSEKKLGVSVPVIIGEEHLGYIHINTDLEGFNKLLRKKYYQRVLVTALIFGFGIVFSFLLFWRYTMPIQEVAKAAQRITEGNLEYMPPSRQRDEVGLLVESFNKMVKGLRERKELENRLKEAERFSAIGQLASGIAHEVRNPLNFISLTIDHIKDKLSPNEELHHLVYNMKGEISSINRMIEDLLDYGRPLKLHLRETDLVLLLEEVLTLTRERIDTQGIRVRKSFPLKSPCMVDRDKVKTCFINITVNAIQAMPLGGELTIRVSQSGPFMDIEFEDTGEGIMPEDMEKVFEPYFTTKEVGIGLGLAITKRIIEEHNGEIRIKSQPLKGTKVKIKLRRQ
ncbi:MAG: ATP-binding protein [Thermodesulfobacteriota bacterium]